MAFFASFRTTPAPQQTRACRSFVKVTVTATTKGRSIQEQTGPFCPEAGSTIAAALCPCQGMPSLLPLREQAIITRNSLKEISERLRTVELEQAKSWGNSKWTDRILWAITSAALGGTEALSLRM